MSYIEEINFRNDDLNKLTEPYAFIKGSGTGMPQENVNYLKQTSILKVLAIDDTFHDLAKARGTTYSEKNFTEKGPANYLLTGRWNIPGNFIKDYKNLLNGTEYTSINDDDEEKSKGKGKKKSSMSFESKVTKAIENQKGLQSANVVITYKQIITGVTIEKEPNPKIVSLSSDLINKIKDSNGSLRIEKTEVSIEAAVEGEEEDEDEDNKRILKGKESQIYSFIGSLVGGNETKINEAYLKIALFIKWYLHTTDLFDFSSFKGTVTNIFELESMKILSDAGISFLGDFFSIRGSGTTTFLAVPCILDSASTSQKRLDESIPIYFEKNPNKTESQLVIVPIVSNYFSCKNYFIGYQFNNTTPFDEDNLFNFSLIIFKIPDSGHDEVRSAIHSIRNEELNSESYNNACETISTYVEANQALICRYYFGECETNLDEETATCGTCGTGIPYIGKLINFLIDHYEDTYKSGKWDSPNVISYKTEFNKLRNAGNLKQRIPIADGRILKLFCRKNEDGAAKDEVFFYMTKENYLELFQILADYKRTGDYQQSYMVLKEIFKNNKQNNKYFTFNTGDELSALVGRFLGVPTIYNSSGQSKIKLFRCNKYMGTETQQLKHQIENNYKRLKDEISQVPGKIYIIKEFIVNNYLDICVLRNGLIKEFKDNYIKIGQTDSPNEDTINKYLYLLELISNIFSFNTFLDNCDAIVKKVASQPTMDKITTVSEANVGGALGKRQRGETESEIYENKKKATDAAQNFARLMGENQYKTDSGEVVSKEELDQSGELYVNAIMYINKAQEELEELIELIENSSFQIFVDKIKEFNNQANVIYEKFKTLNDDESNIELLNNMNNKITELIILISNIEETGDIFKLYNYINNNNKVIELTKKSKLNRDTAKIIKNIQNNIKNTSSYITNFKKIEERSREKAIGEWKKKFNSLSQHNDYINKLGDDWFEDYRFDFSTFSTDSVDAIIDAIIKNDKSKYTDEILMEKAKSEANSIVDEINIKKTSNLTKFNTYINALNTEIDCDENKTEIVNYIENNFESALKGYITDIQMNGGGRVRRPSKESRTIKKSKSKSTTIVSRILPDIKIKINKNSIYHEVKKIVTGIMNRCMIYMNDVIKTKTDNFTDAEALIYLKELSKKYRVQEFCYNLLFNQPDEDDGYTLDGGNIGLLVSLQLLAEKYRKSDVYPNESDETFFTLPDLLRFLSDTRIIQFINSLLITLISLSNSSEPGSDTEKMTVEGDEQTASVEGSISEDSEQLYLTSLGINKEQFLESISVNKMMKNIYTEIETYEDGSLTKCIFSIFNIGLINSVYFQKKYGISNNKLNKLCNYEQSEVLNLLPNISNYDSDEAFLKQGLGQLLDFAYNKTRLCFGINVESSRSTRSESGSSETTGGSDQNSKNIERKTRKRINKNKLTKKKRIFK